MEPETWNPELPVENRQISTGPMCLIVFAYKLHPDHPLIIAANRDEFYERPTRKAQFWDDHPGLLAGRDMKYGGTWMGITISGRFAAITNFRDQSEFSKHPLSRGLLVTEFLTGSEPPETFLDKVILRKEKYNGFNLLAGDLEEMVYYSNRDPARARILKPGIYGLSNHLLDTPWPKLTRSRKALRDNIKSQGIVAPDSLFKILSNRTAAKDDELPDTGFGVEWERILSSPFIATEVYGTRTSSVLLMNAKRYVRFEERSFTKAGEPDGRVLHEFQIAEG